MSSRTSAHQFAAFKMVGRRSAGPTLQKFTASERTTTTSVERSLLRIEDITADNQLDQIAQPIILLSEL